MAMNLQSTTDISGLLVPVLTLERNLVPTLYVLFRIALQVVSLDTMSYFRAVVPVVGTGGDCPGGVQSKKKPYA